MRGVFVITTDFVKRRIYFLLRVSTIKDSDKIIVLKDGLIAEEGSHDELIEHGGLYDRMYRMQLIEEMDINGGEAV